MNPTFTMRVTSVRVNDGPPLAKGLFRVLTDGTMLVPTAEAAKQYGVCVGMTLEGSGDGPWDKAPPLVRTFKVEPPAPRTHVQG